MSLVVIVINNNCHWNCLLNGYIWHEHVYGFILFNREKLLKIIAEYFRVVRMTNQDVGRWQPVKWFDDDDDDDDNIASGAVTIVCCCCLCYSIVISFLLFFLLLLLLHSSKELVYSTSQRNVFYLYECRRRCYWLPEKEFVKIYKHNVTYIQINFT